MNRYRARPAPRADVTYDDRPSVLIDDVLQWSDEIRKNRSIRPDRHLRELDDRLMDKRNECIAFTEAVRWGSA